MAERRPLAVVTGASSGIGFELARVCADQGFDLLIAAEHAGIEQAKARLEKSGGRVDAIQVDLSTRAGSEKFVTRVRALERPVDVLILNAGVGVNGDFVREVPLEKSFEVINLNIGSTVHLAKRLIWDMVNQGHGRVLFTSSVVSKMPGPFEAVYSASKAFIHNFAEAIRDELRDTGVTITSLLPGATETNFFHRAGMDDTRVGVEKKDDAAKVALEGFTAMMRGKDHVVAGSFKNKIQVGFARILPEPIVARIHRRLTSPGSAAKAHKKAA